MFRSYTDREIGKYRKRPKISDDNTRTPRNCDICDEMYFSETEVEVHKQTRHSYLVWKKKMPTCLVCTKTFHLHSELIAHIKLMHLYSTPDATRVEQEIYVCDWCSKIFFLKSLLTVHIYTRHRIFNVHDRKNCPICDKLVLLSSMWYHMETHCIKSVSTCNLCLKTVADREALAEHIKRHSGHYKCQMCDYITTKSENFHKHLADNHRPKDDNFVINNIELSTCFVPFKKPVVYKYRVQFVTAGLDLYSMLHICVLCREICETREQMAKHVVLHKNQTVEVKKNEKICACGAVFTNDILLKHHIFKLKGLHRKVDSLDEVITIPEDTTEVNEIILGDVGGGETTEISDEINDDDLVHGADGNENSDVEESEVLEEDELEYAIVQNEDGSVTLLEDQS